MKDVEMPKKETREKRLLVPVTPTEHKKIMDYCKNRKVSLAELMRFALKQTFDL